jgi:rhodanese-related sulfurtransferase
MKIVLSILLSLVMYISQAGDLDSWKKMLSEDKAIGLDIRSYPELKLNPAEGAVHLSYFGFSQDKIKALNMDPNKTILVFCESGGRASKALDDLKKAGFSKVINIKDWRTWNKIKN